MTEEIHSYLWGSWKSELFPQCSTYGIVILPTRNIEISLLPFWELTFVFTELSQELELIREQNASIYFVYLFDLNTKTKQTCQTTKAQKSLGLFDTSVPSVRWYNGSTNKQKKNVKSVLMMIKMNLILICHYLISIREEENVVWKQFYVNHQGVLWHLMTWGISLSKRNSISYCFFDWAIWQVRWQVTAEKTAGVRHYPSLIWQKILWA